MKEDNSAELLSAYAVYKGLIPGVKSYVDTSVVPNVNKKQKRIRNVKEFSSVIKKNSVATSGTGQKFSAYKTAREANKVEKLPSPITAHIKPRMNGDNSVKPKGTKIVQTNPSKANIDSNVMTKQLDNQSSSSPKKKRDRKRTLEERNVNGKPSELPNPKVAKLIGIASHGKNSARPNAMYLPNPFSQNYLNQRFQTTPAGSSPPIVADKVLPKKLTIEVKTPTAKVGAAVRPTEMKRTVISSLPMRPNKDAQNIKPVSSRPEKAVQNTSIVNEEAVGEKIPLTSLFTHKPIWDSVEHGKSVFEWLISPISADKFMDKFWEKKPLHIKRSETNYYQWLLSSEKIDGILRTNTLKYQKNIDITSFSKSNNVRETQSEELEGRARPAVVWDYYNNGCSIRILNPQSYIKPLLRLNASLQEWFGSFVGANAYLTPADSQGFAPHYDDIEAFIIQIEGKKHWKLYNPMSKDEVLPRFSSPNFSEEKDKLGKPILDVVLEEGDLLYFPRGTIHQAMANDTHSLHITLSCHQKNSWGDMLKEHLNNVVDRAMASDVEFRRGLPTDYLSFMGISHQETEDREIKDKRGNFQKTVKRLIRKMLDSPADYAADQMGKKFIWDSLPPYLNKKEKDITVNEDGEFMQSGIVMNRCEMDPDVEIKLLRKNCIRLVVEEGTIRLYFNTENSLVYHEEEAQFLEMSTKTAPAIQFLINRYPEFVKIDELPINTKDVSEKVQVAADLWERGLLMTKMPLETADEVDFDSDEVESIGKDSDEHLDDEELGEEVDSDENIEEEIEGDSFLVESDSEEESDDDEEGDEDSFESELDDEEEDLTSDDELTAPKLV